MRQGGILAGILRMNPGL